MEHAAITVKVSPELLAQLGEWSEPLQVRVVPEDTGYTMIFRRPESKPLPDKFPSSTVTQVVTRRGWGGGVVVNEKETK